MARLLRDRYLWYIVAIMLLTGILLYTTETYVLGWLPSQENWNLTYLTLLNLMFLMAVAIAAWRFGVGGGLRVCLIAGVILLPHAVFEIGVLRIDWVAELMVIGAVGIPLSWLVGSRKRMTEALRQSGEKYRSLVNNVKLGVFRSTPGATGRFLEVNPAMEEITGYSREELLQMNVSDLYVHPEERELVLEEIASSEGETTRELCFRKKDGTEITVSDTKVAVRDNAGRILFFDGILEDVTERKRAEEELRHAAEQWRSTFDSITDSVSIVDKDFKLVRVNKAYADAFKIQPKELIGKTCYEVVHGRKEPLPGCPHKQTLETRKPARLEFFEPRLGVHLEVSTSPIFDNRGEVVASVHTAKDITERKLAEAEKRELEQKAQLASRLASVGEMASGIAHEINNPLTSVIGFTQLLIQKDIPDDIKQDVKVINDGAQRVAGIVKRLLTFARQHKLERKYVDINEVIKTTLDLRAYELKTGNIKVTTQLTPDLPRTMADGGQLQQVFLNIIINAEKEMRLAHGRGNLLIKTETIDNTIGVSFKDDGPGIAEENLEKIFDPFFTTRDAGQGTGLGLSVCHGIMAEHNGRIYGESELGKGATFVVELPLVCEPEQPEVPEVAKPATDEAQRLTGAKILVVDDEPAVRQFLSRLLADEGHKVETVDNASDALERVKSRGYNLILLDIKMPGMSGFELYKRVREVAQPLAARMVFITGDVMGIDTRNFFSKTKAPYIVKPFDAEKLKKDINRLLAKRAKK